MRCGDRSDNKSYVSFPDRANKVKLGLYSKWDAMNAIRRENAQYDAIPFAVRFVELFLKRQLADMIAEHWPPDKVVFACKKLAEVPADGPRVEAVRVLALAEMEHTQFLTYIAGRLGAV